MVSTRHRQNDIKLPYNIWNGESERNLKDGERICEECGGCGGHNEAGSKHGLIQMCPNCRGKGHKDWIDRAIGNPSDGVGHYITTNIGDDFAIEVEEGEKDEFKEKISLQVAGEFKFVYKDEL